MRARFIAVPAVVFASLLAALTTLERRVYVPYADFGGVLTVCDGITGKDVIAGKTYTDAECDALGKAYVEKMAAQMGKCVPVELEFHELKAWGSFAYNVGTPAFCRSTAAKLLNQGQNEAACKQILRWKYIGGKDCSVRANKCYGIVKRRQWEYQTCMGVL